MTTRRRKTRINLCFGSVLPLPVAFATELLVTAEGPGPDVIKLFMLSSAEHGILAAHKLNT